MSRAQGSKPSILFISALDFKEKSIQVIRKTPEAFRDQGWEVTFLVARDLSRGGDYFYERVADPSNMRVVRIGWPLVGLQDAAGTGFMGTVVSKLRGYLVVARLAARAAALTLVRRFDVIYGYEAHGYLALCLLRLLGLSGGARSVARFQGFKEKRGAMALLNWEMFLALLLPAHLCIMTDDGTQGDRLLSSIGSPNRKRLRFWVNGVDRPTPASLASIERTRRELGCPPGCFLLMSISRLVPWKRVDRGIEIVERLVKRHSRHDVRYCVVGGGADEPRLRQLVESKDLGNYVFFTGPVDHGTASRYLQAADAFLSLYDLSNVGNPLLEAIRAHKAVFTLDNGDTGRWIQPGRNGFIYPPNDSSLELLAQDLDRFIDDPDLRRRIYDGVRETERERLWDWDSRLMAEVKEVAALIGRGR